MRSVQLGFGILNNMELNEARSKLGIDLSKSFTGDVWMSGYTPVLDFDLLKYDNVDVILMSDCRDLIDEFIIKCSREISKGGDIRLSDYISFIEDKIEFYEIFGSAAL